MTIKSTVNTLDFRRLIKCNCTAYIRIFVPHAGMSTATSDFKALGRVIHNQRIPICKSGELVRPELSLIKFLVRCTFIHYNPFGQFFSLVPLFTKPGHVSAHARSMHLESSLLLWYIVIRAELLLSPRPHISSPDPELSPDFLQLGIAVNSKRAELTASWHLEFLQGRP